MGKLTVNTRTRVRRAPARAVTERTVLNQIIDESYVCHVGFNDQEQPVVIPTLGWRDGDTLYIHGSRGSRMLNVIKAGGKVCITFTLLDGLVMARSAFHHSANYRSAVVFGLPVLVEDRQAKLDALNVFMDKIAPGRWVQLRETNEQEISATDVFRLPLDEASVKVRSGGPVDDDADLSVPVWAGTIAVRQQIGPALNAADNLPGQATPDYSAAFGNRWFAG